MEKLLNDYKISFTKGDTYALAVKFKNITDDLSSAYFTVKENADDEPLIQKSLGAGVSKIDDRTYKQEKTYKIQLQSEDTANLEPLVQYLYDFRVAFGNVVQTILSGVFVVKHSISDVSTTSTTTLEVALADVIESEVTTSPATSGIEYEQDPVACAKIGDLTQLTTTAKETIVKAINEAVTKNTATQTQVNKILNGTTTVPKATDAENAVNANNATNATNAVNATVAQYASNDKTKGTIEERLTSLGFKQGSVSIASKYASSTSVNSLKKQGKIVRLDLKIDTSTSNALTNGGTIGTIPEEYRPSEDVSILCGIYGSTTVPAGSTLTSTRVTLMSHLYINASTGAVTIPSYSEISLNEMTMVIVESVAYELE